MFKTSTWWLWWLYHLFILTGGLVLIGHIVPFAVENRISSARAAFAMGVFSVSNGAGRLLGRRSVGKFGRNNTMVFNSSTLIIGMVSLLFLTKNFGYAGLTFSIILIGLSYGGSVPNRFPALISSCFGNKNFGTNYGLGTTPLIIGALVGPYLGGYIRAATSSYEAVIYCSAGFAILALFQLSP